MSKEMEKSPSEASACSPSYPASIVSIDSTTIESDYEIIKFSEVIKMSEIEKCKRTDC